MVESKSKPVCEEKAPDISESPPDMPSGLKIYIDPMRCTGCGLCAELCPFDLPHPDMIGKYSIERADLCTECSACKRNCPAHAIIMQEQKGCGCLWNVAADKHSNKKNSKSCC